MKSPEDSRGPATLQQLLMRRPVFVVSVVILALIMTAVAVAPLLSPYPPLQQDLLHTFALPSATHVLGTDDLGRDVLSRLLHGGRETLLGVVQALTVFLLVGTSLGLAAGMSRGVVDTVIARMAELLLSIPAFILLLVMLSILPGNMTVAMVALGLLTSPLLIRVVRGTTRGVRSELFVHAARSTGLSEAQITMRHVLPRLAGPIIVQATIFSGTVIIAETGLGYLGFGIALPAPSWGNMVETASQNITRAPWLLIPTGGVIIVTILCFMLIGDGVRDAVADRWSGAGHRVRARKQVVQIPAPTTAGDVGDALLRVSGLTVVIDTPHGEVPLVKDVSFHVRYGETLCLVGESGSGKSVTSLSILGLGRGTRIAAGSIQVEGVEMVGAAAEQLRRLRMSTFGYITQDPQPSLDPSMRVGDLLAQLVRLHQDVDRRAAARIAVELLTRVRIPEPRQVARKYPHQLSGGMAQRVVIAAALSARPKVLLADEPTTALDVTVQAEILALLHELCKADQSMSLLLVTHDWGVVADIADRVAVLRNGGLVETGDVDEVFTTPRHEHTRAMLDADPARLPVRAVRIEMPPLLTVRNLVVNYRSRDAKGRASTTTAVNSIDLDIQRGRTLGLIGESGSGKSSVGGAITGLVDAASGSILVHGPQGDAQEIMAVGPARRRELTRRVQIIFQDPYGSLNPVRTIGAILSEPLVLAHGMSQRDASRLVADALVRVGLPVEASRRYPAYFSGGQRQRVAIARALVLGPELIVCDEPVSALDLSIQEQVLALLNELQAERDISYLFISHDLSVVRSFCDDIAVMYRGSIVEQGTAADVILTPQHPYTRALLEAAPIPDPAVQRGRSRHVQRFLA